MLSTKAQSIAGQKALSPMRVFRLFKLSFASTRSPFSVPRVAIKATSADVGTDLRAAWPKAPAPRWNNPHKPVPGAQQSFGSRGMQFRQSDLRPADAAAIDLTFAHSQARASRIARGLKQAGILAQPNRPLMQLPTYSLLQGRLSRTDALKGKHMLSQKEWAAVWVALNVHHHGLKNVPTRITRLPMEMRYDFFVVAGVTDRPEESRHWVHTLRDAGVLSRRLHLKSFAAMPQAAAALGLSAESDLVARIQDSVFVLPEYTFSR